MAMPVMPVRTARPEPHRLQFDIGDTSGDVQPGLSLRAARLQRAEILRTATQECAAATDADRRVGADAAVIAGEIAASNPGGRRVDRPAQPGLVGDAEVEPEATDGRQIWFGTTALALEHTFQAGGRANDESDILAAFALQDTCAELRLRQRVGACRRCSERSDGDTECRETHMSDPNVDWICARDRKDAPCPKQGASKNVAVKTSNVRRRSELRRDLTISNCHKSAGCVCRLPRDRSFSPHRKSGTPGQARTPNPAPPRRLRFPTAR